MAKKLKEVKIEEQSEQLEQIGNVILPTQNWYAFNWDKVQSLDDIKNILSQLGMTVSDMAPGYENLKKYLKDEVEYTTS